MHLESSSETLYVTNPRVLSSIKSCDSLIIRGVGTPFELPLTFFQVLMAFAEGRTLRQALQSLNTDIPIEDFSSIVNEFVERGLLRSETPCANEVSLRHLLNPKVFSDPVAIEKIGRWMRLGHAVIVPDALPIEFATEVYQDLNQSTHWLVSEGGHDFFHYRNCAITQLDGLTPALSKCARLFGNITTRRFICELSERDCTGEAGVAAAWYRPNEYALPHDDSSLNDPRSVAYIWYLTKEWRPEWGGALFWCPTGQYILPLFNMLIMFKVTPSNIHWVCPVSPSATTKRLTINGFWNRTSRDSVSDLRLLDSFISPRVYGSPAPEVADLEPMIIL